MIQHGRGEGGIITVGAHTGTTGRTSVPSSAVDLLAWILVVVEFVLNLVVPPGALRYHIRMVALVVVAVMVVLAVLADADCS